MSSTTLRIILALNAAAAVCFAVSQDWWTVAWIVIASLWVLNAYCAEHRR